MTYLASKNEYLPFNLPDLGNEEVAQIKEVIDSRWLTTGPKTKEFEQKFARAVGAQHAVAVNSCTAALHLSLEAIGLSQGDRVLTSPYTFAATAEVIRYFGAVPVFVDIQADSFNIDPNLIEEAVRREHRRGREIRAIIPVHIAGLPCDLDAVFDIAERYEIAVIEDAAHAFPASCSGLPIGAGRSRKVPHLCGFSFYATKTITTAEGGMITCEDKELTDRCRIMSLHGISRDAWKRYAAQATWRYEIIAPGYKYNMPDLAAAIGLAQLAKAERMCQRRSEIAACYTESFSNSDLLEPPIDRETARSAWHLYMLRLHLDRLRVDRDTFIQELSAQGIGTSVHFIPLHLHPYYVEQFGLKPGDYPVSTREYLREISLPLYNLMSEDDVARVVDTVRTTAERHRRIRS